MIEAVKSLFDRITRYGRGRFSSLRETLLFTLEQVYFDITRKNEFVTERRRPRNVPTRGPGASADLRSDTAVVVQGPIIWHNQLSRRASDEFTLETLRQYRITYPNAPIILSTWERQCSLAVHTWCRKWEINLVAQPEPPNRGLSNMNLQMMSSAEGVLCAESLGAAFTLKTRTDQRIGSGRLLQLLHSALEVFPPIEGTPHQQKRLIALSFNTFLYRLYGVSDMFMFGATSDVATYWNGRIDPRPPKWERPAHTAREYAALRICEVEYCAAFLESTGWDLRWSLSDYWDALRRRFIVLDATSVDFLWPKYSRLEERWSMHQGFYHEEVSFASWLSMVSGVGMKADETLLDLPFSQFMP